MQLSIFTICLVGFFAQGASSGSVLFYMPYISKSVRITFMPLAEELAKRGHEVTVITGQKPDKAIKNIKEISIDSLINKQNELFSELMLSDHDPYEELEQLKFLYFNGLQTNNMTLRHPEIQKLLKENAKFDVVINSVFIANEMGYFLAHKFNASLILYYTLQCSEANIDRILGQPHSPAIMTPVCVGYKHPASFLQRVANTLISIVMRYFRDFSTFPRLEQIIDEVYPNEPRPSLQEIESNAALAIQFGHPLIMDGLRPMAPNYVQVGMMNCRPAKALPKNLQQFLDGADEKHGAIMVSFGTVLTGSKMSEEKRKMLLDVFGRLKQRVLWKWETEEMPDKPENVMLSKWLPQQDVLAHPKVRLFVSHGGQSSCQESLCHQKPLVVVSVFSDQPTNGEEAASRGYGIHVPFKKATAESLHNAIQEVLNNPKYSYEAKRIGELLLDQIEKPLDRAVWWIEYTMRHPGLKHFRSPVHDLTWYQYFLLDVVAFFVAIFVAIVLILVTLCRCACKKGSKTKTE